jgi:hypothetical protein
MFIEVSDIVKMRSILFLLLLVIVSTSVLAKWVCVPKQGPDCQKVEEYIFIERNFYQLKKIFF